jgi:hypothetical protein
MQPQIQEMLAAGDLVDRRRQRIYSKLPTSANYV